MTLRAALIGCGKIGSQFAFDPKAKPDIITHAEAYTRCPATELVAVCDTDREGLAACASRWRVPSQFSSLEQMLAAENLDLVSVCTPDDTHYSIVRQVLNQGRGLRAILCEKPLAQNVREAHELVRLASKQGVLLAVMYVRRYAENIRNLRSFLSRGSLGEIQGVTGWYTKGVLHNGSHWFDLLRYLVREVEWLCAWNRWGDSSNDPALDVVLGLAGGAFASLRSCDASHFTVFEMDLMGTRGRVRLTDAGRSIEYSRVQDSPHFSGYRELAGAGHDFGEYADVMLHAVTDVVEAIESGCAPACGGDDGLHAVAIADAARLAAQKNRHVLLSEVLSAP